MARQYIETIVGTSAESEQYLDTTRHKTYLLHKAGDTVALKEHGDHGETYHKYASLGRVFSLVKEQGNHNYWSELALFLGLKAGFYRDNIRKTGPVELALRRHVLRQKIS